MSYKISGLPSIWYYMQSLHLLWSFNVWIKSPISYLVLQRVSLSLPKDRRGGGDIPLITTTFNILHPRYDECPSYSQKCDESLKGFLHTFLFFLRYWYCGICAYSHWIGELHISKDDPHLFWIRTWCKYLNG